MYMTLFAGSPCEKTVSFASNSATVLPRATESRNNFTSKTGFLKFAFLGELWILIDTPRAGSGNKQENSIEPDLAGCSILHTFMPLRSWWREDSFFITNGGSGESLGGLSRSVQI